MQYVRFVLSMAFFVPDFVLFGLQGWGGDWYGGVVGGMIAGKRRGVGWTCFTPRMTGEKSDRNPPAGCPGWGGEWRHCTSRKPSNLLPNLLVFWYD
jgi:hypothetical protein